MSASVAPGELARRIREGAAPRLLDVREPWEHALASLPGARLVPLGELAERAEELRDWAGDEIVVYCHHGVRSMRAIAQLRVAGFERLLNLQGGIDLWSVEVDPGVPRY